jgi:5-methylcytosine-specific restriction endonuclease McrA
VTRRTWGGRKLAQFRALVFATYGTTCHLCEQPGADTIDHLIPAYEAPHLEYDLRNMRPAHGPCNYSRGTKPLEQWFAQREAHRVALAPSRDW